MKQHITEKQLRKIFREEHTRYMETSDKIQWKLILTMIILTLIAPVTLAIGTIIAQKLGLI